MHTAKFHKKHRKLWRTGLLIGNLWVSWHKGIHVYHKNVAASKLSHAYNFYS